MKKLLIGFLALVSCTSAFAEPESVAKSFSCNDAGFGGAVVVLKNEISAICGDYKIKISGLNVGLGFHQNGEKESFVQCPFIEPEGGTYYGLNATADLFVGVEFAIFAGKKGVCFVEGLGYGIGASVGGSKLTIEKI
jgi:hypothetical protein